MDKNEVETLLKKGYLGMINPEQEEGASKAYFEDNIDEILKKNTR